MRTIEEVVNELKNMTEPSSESHYNSDVVYCQRLLDEILEIDKQNNESVKGDLISKSAAIDVMWDVFNQYCNDADRFDEYETEAISRAFKLLQSVIEKQPTTNDSWIPCSERLPEVETKVLIHAKRKYRDGSFRDIITTAMYEDGTMLEDDSKWHWEDIEGEWDEENDCYFIPEGWWEDKMYNADGELNHAIDDEVIEWQPIPELCQLER